MGIEEHGGAGVNNVERFDHMLPLALGIGRHAGHILEINLPDAHGGGPLQGLMDAWALLADALMAFQYAINGLARGDRELEELQHGIALEVIADRLLTWHAAQAFWGLIADGEDLLDDQRMRWGGWGLTCPRVTLQNQVQALACGQFFPKALEPFFHPTLGTAQGSSKLAM